MARSQASGLKVLPSRRPRETDSQRERKKVASYWGFHVKRGPRCLPGPDARPLPAPAAEKSSSDMAGGREEPSLLQRSAGGVVWRWSCVGSRRVEDDGESEGEGEGETEGIRALTREWP